MKRYIIVACIMACFFSIDIIQASAEERQKYCDLIRNKGTNSFIEWSNDNYPDEIHNGDWSYRKTEEIFIFFIRFQPGTIVLNINFYELREDKQLEMDHRGNKIKYIPLNAIRQFLCSHGTFFQNFKPSIFIDRVEINSDFIDEELLNVGHCDLHIIKNRSQHV